VIVQAPAKINLALTVGPIRGDGFHELTTLFQSIELGDELEVREAADFELAVAGDAPPGEDNLVARAARRLAQTAGVRCDARIALRKRLPAGAGLGGGSSDAAAALVALDRLWKTGAGIADLHEIACEIGSDVPFFLLGGTALGLGRGEQLFALDDLPPHHVVLALPGLHLKTAEMFAAHDRKPARERRSWPHAALWRWQRSGLRALTNDLERPVFARYPRVAAAKAMLLDAAADHALMSGSGSSVFGLFRSVSDASAASRALAGAGLPAVQTLTLSRGAYAERRFQSGPGSLPSVESS